MPEILIINKDSNIEQKHYDNISDKDLYKKCNFRKQEDFNKQIIIKFSLNNNIYIIELYGKIIGRKNNKNNYILPKIFGNIHLYGNYCLILLKDDNVINFKTELWSKIYNLDNDSIINYNLLQKTEETTETIKNIENTKTIETTETTKNIENIKNIQKTKITKTKETTKNTENIETTEKTKTTEKTNTTEITNNIETTKTSENVDNETDVNIIEYYSELSEEEYEYD